MSAEQLKRITQLIEEKLAGSAIFLVSADMVMGNELRIVLDGDHGVKIEDCVALSRYIGNHIEEHNWIEQAYRLEVTSFGVGNPLVQHRQYLNNIDRKVEIKTGQGIIEGWLKEVHETYILVEEVQKTKGRKAETIQKEIPFSEIVETKILITF